MRLLFWKGRTRAAGFRDRFRATLLERHPGASAVDEGTHDLRVEGLSTYTSATLNLSRAYAEFERDPAQFDSIFDRYSASLSTDPASDVFDLGAVVPMIKDREWLAPFEGGAHAEAPGNIPFAVPLNAELVVAYAEFTQTMWLLTRDALAARRLDPEELHARARGARGPLGSASSPRR